MDYRKTLNTLTNLSIESLIAIEALIDAGEHPDQVDIAIEMAIQSHQKDNNYE